MRVCLVVVSVECVCWCVIRKSLLARFYEGKAVHYTHTQVHNQRTEFNYTRQIAATRLSLPVFCEQMDRMFGM